MSEIGRRASDDANSMSGLVSLLTELSRAANMPIERHAARRMLDEARSVWPGTFEQQWWKWVIEAGQAVGLSLRATDISMSAAVALAASHLPVATCWKNDDQSWLVLSNAPGIHLHVTAGVAGGTPKAVVTDRAERHLQSLKLDLPERWVVAESHSTLASDHTHSHMPPRLRLWKLLNPEWNDIWVICVVALFIGVLATAVPIAAQQLVRTVTFGTLYQPILILTVVLLGFLLFMAALQALTIFIAELIQQRLFARLVADLSYRLPRVRHEVADANSLPELVNRFFDIVTVQKVVAGLMVDGIAVVLTTIVGMALLAFYHPFLLGYDIVLLILMVLVIVLVGRGGTQTVIRESIAKYRTAAWLEDVARCLVSFKMYGASDFAVDRADRLTADYLTHRQQHFKIMLRQVLCILGLQAIASTVLLGLGGWLVIHEQLTLGQLVAAELVLSNIVGSFAKLIKHIEGYYDLMAAMDKLGHLVDLPMESQRGLMTLPGSAAADVNVRNLCISPPHEDHHELEADEYAAGSHNLIDHLSFHVPAGQTLGIHGPPGSGKTLLMDTLFELHKPTNGAVMLDGIDITDLRPEVLRRYVTLVRDVELLNGTVSENVHFSRPDVDTTHVREALTVARLIDELRYLPRGIETEISSTGRPLSQSQTRRLMLARALAGRPRLVLIDELLDGLSDELLDDFWQSYRELPSHPTMIIVTGRQSILEKCDQVLTLDRGIDHHSDDSEPHSSSGPRSHRGSSSDRPPNLGDFRNRG